MLLTPHEFTELVEMTVKAESVEDIHRVCTRICSLLGFDFFIYGAQFPVSLVKPQIIIVSGYPKEWRDHYNTNNYVSIDPTVAHCREHVVPLAWEDIERGAGSPKGLARFLSDADDFGIRSGASFPVHGSHGESAILSFASTSGAAQSAADIRTALPFGHALASYIHEAIRRVFGEEYLMVGQCKLSEREQECLMWSAEGKTAWEIAQILSISERTANYHLLNCTRKLDVSNRQQAIARAISQSLIVPDLR